MQHKGTQTLETPRLILRRFQPEDAQDVFSNWMGQTEVARYTGWPVLENVFETEGLVTAWCAAYEDPHIYNWAITCKGDGHAIGAVSAVNFSDRHARCEIDYALAKQYWNTGIMTEALGAVIDYLLCSVGCHKICGCCAAENPASGRVMEKCGMVREGYQRGQYKNREGTYSDLVLYGLLQEDYKKGKT